MSIRWLCTDGGRSEGGDDGRVEERELRVGRLKESAGERVLV